MPNIKNLHFTEESTRIGLLGKGRSTRSQLREQFEAIEQAQESGALTTNRARSLMDYLPRVFSYLIRVPRVNRLSRK